MDKPIELQLSLREAKSLLIVLGCLSDYDDYATYLEWIRNDLTAIRLRLEAKGVDLDY